MAYREYKGRIGGMNHWLFAQDDFAHIIERPFRGEQYARVINGSGIVKGEQKYPKGYQEMIIPELKRRADFFKEIQARLARRVRYLHGLFLHCLPFQLYDKIAMDGQWILADSAPSGGVKSYRYRRLLRRESRRTEKTLPRSQSEQDRRRGHRRLCRRRIRRISCRVSFAYL